jgi:hypothetical protein
VTSSLENHTFLQPDSEPQFGRGSSAGLLLLYRGLLLLA